jgi:uncharacterized protein YndB with AHSA1/START domain
MTDRSTPIVVEQTFPVSRAKLWNAITQHDQMIQWFFEDIPDFRPEVGFTTQFNVHSGGRNFLHVWSITESIPGHKIVYDWRYKDLPGVGKVTFEILEGQQGSRLRVINEGLDSFPSDVPEFTRESCVRGWKYLVQESLRDFLEPAEN